MAAGDDLMGELGLQELLRRFDRLDQAVDENVERVADHVIKLETKLDGLVEGQARLEGTLEAHIGSEETWRREVSERINLSEVETKHRVKEARDEAVRLASEAKTLAELAGKSRSDWTVRWQTVVAMICLAATIIGAMVGYTKLTEAHAKSSTHVSSPISPASP